MKLNKELLKTLPPNGYAMPTYDREMVTQQTLKAPFWMHFGAGNIFRALHAPAVEQLLNDAILDRGLIVAEGYDYAIIDKINHPCDDLTILCTLKGNGSVSKQIIGSIVASYRLDGEDATSFTSLKALFINPSLQMVTFTITEKGYSLKDGQGNVFPIIIEDFLTGPNQPKSYLGKVTALLYQRYLANETPLAMVSMDNCSHNGTKLYEAIFAYGKAWHEKGFVSEAFLDYLNDKVSFPWTMIDKITPRPNPSVMKMLADDGFEEMNPIITDKNTYIAPFVNVEEAQYLVIEDLFPNGRPPLEKAGFIFTDRDTVNKVEKMKVCTCLNPLHTALAIFGCLLNYQLIADEMNNPLLKKLVEGIGYVEGLPVVTDPVIIDPKVFMDTVITQRLPNPFMPDAPQRIATDTSQKIAIRFGETIKSYRDNPRLNPGDLTLIPLVLAGWFRYLMGIDDMGNPFEISPDPLLGKLLPFVHQFSLGSYTAAEVETVLAPLLKDITLFGVDLYEVDLALKVCDYFTQLVAGKDAVKRTLSKYLNQ